MEHTIDGREKILIAAIDAFASAGYDGTSTAGVARAAGVAQPLIHHHFGSKEGLWRAAMDRVFDAARPFNRLDPGLPPDKALVHVLEDFMRLSATRPEMAKIIAREGATESWRLEYLVNQHLREQYTQAVETFRLAQRLELIDQGLRPELVLIFVLGSCTHFFDIAPLGRLALGLDAEGEDREAFIQMVIKLLMRGIGVQEGAET